MLTHASSRFGECPAIAYAREPSKGDFVFTCVFIFFSFLFVSVIRYRITENIGYPKFLYKVITDIDIGLWRKYNYNAK